MKITKIEDLPQEQQDLFLTYVKYVVIDHEDYPLGGFRTAGAAERWMSKCETE